MVAIAFSAGIAGAWHLPSAAPVLWIASSVSTAGTAIFLLVIGRSRAASAALLLAVACLGGVWLALRHHAVAPHDLAAAIPESPALVRARGAVASSPLVRDTATGALSRFNYQPPATFFQVDVESLVTQRGAEQRAAGRVLVRCDESLPPLRPGDRVEVSGWLGRFPPPRNPGEFDRATYARVLGQAGMLRVPQRELVRVIETRRSTWIDHFRDWRQRARAAATGWLLTDLPFSQSTERQALLAALLIGERGPDLIELNQTFQRTGLAHLLAISGAHLGVLAATILLILRLVSPPRRWHGVVLIAIILFYLFLIETRMPVLRAAIMTCAAALGIVFGRRLTAGGLVALSGLLLLVWSPQQLFDAGFQLSYGVVLGLIAFSALLRHRLCGPRNQLAASTSAMAWEWIKTLLAASIVAWAVATPIVIYHFGMMTPWAALASVIALPLVSILLAIGYLKMLCGALLPSASMLLGPPLTLMSDVLVSFVRFLDSLPLSFIPLPTCSTAWVIAALAVIGGWFTHRGRGQRVLLSIASLALALWLFWPLLPVRHEPPLRIDMLAVGDGSCYIIRSEGTTIVFDCGSSTDLDAGRAQVVPAFEALGVRSIDAIIVSHANLDHFSALLEVVERFAVARVIVTPQFLAGARANPMGPAAFVLEDVTRRRIAIDPISAGDERQFGRAHWTCLHPAAEASFGAVNDTSTVFAIEVESRRVLLAGDVQREAMAMLLADPASLDADVLELPHHGSHHDVAVAFVQAVTPEVVLQSTGWSRWEQDRWGATLAASRRLVTARDGACRVEIDEGGRIRTGAFGSD